MHACASHVNRWMVRGPARNRDIPLTLPPKAAAVVTLSKQGLQISQCRRKRHWLQWRDLESKRAETYLNIDLQQNGIGGDDSWSSPQHAWCTLWPKKYQFAYHFKLGA